MKILNSKLILGLLAEFLSFSVLAEGIATDRPDATESSSVVQPGYIQAELGWLYTEDDDTKTHELPQTLIRWGIADQIELRLGWNGYIDANGSDGVDGAGDGEWGAKFYVAEEDGVLPETAFLVGISLPWGDQEISSDEVDPHFRFAVSHTLSDTLSLGYNLGAEWATKDDSTLGSFVYTMALGMALSDSWGAYVEFFGDIGLSASGTAHSFDGGFTYLVRDNFQLDAFAGVGLSDDAVDWFAGAGISYRLPN